jgi:hypothetical protein
MRFSWIILISCACSGQSDPRDQLDLGLIKESTLGISDVGFSGPRQISAICIGDAKYFRNHRVDLALGSPPDTPQTIGKRLSDACAAASKTAEELRNAPEPHRMRSFTTPRGTIIAPGSAFIDGRELGSSFVVTPVNLWMDTTRASISCRLPHGASVRVRGVSKHPTEDREYAAVTSGNCSGWLPLLFLSPVEPE